MSQIGKNIQKIRKVKGLSQQAFAELFQLTRGNISSYEELRAEPKLSSTVEIANYFSIPVGDFISKDLSVNELLHYNTGLVLETEELKRNHRLIHIPYISVYNLPEFIAKYNDENFIQSLPHIIIPNNSEFQLIAIEVSNSENFPLGFDYKNGDILFYEKVVKENIHRLKDKLGIKIDASGIKAGIFEIQEQEIFLALNELVKYPFDIHSDSEYWILRSAYIQY